ncbi:T9SS type A sorting domain-containing protein [bacterium]
MTLPTSRNTFWTLSLIVIIIFFFVLFLPTDAVSTQIDILIRIPSTVAGAEGLMLRITPPASPRFIDHGAPILIYMPGGFRSDGLSERVTELNQNGFIEIRFNFQGGGTEPNRSGGGPFDYRGHESLIAARDVIRFATGELTDMSGRLLEEIVNPIIPLYANTGLIGWSNGGNTNICVAGVYGQEISGLAWIINWESPVGDGMPQAEAGSKVCTMRPLNQEVNPAYNPDTGVWDLSTLSYDPQIQLPILENVTENVLGGLFFDFDSDGVVDPGEDFIPYPLVYDMGEEYESYYSERLRQEAGRENLMPNPAPAHQQTAAETESFWACRNGEYWIDSVLTKLPEVMFMVVANDTDHVQRSPDHPHVLLQYERFRMGGARFVRLNPDRAYAEALLGYPFPEAVDNDAFSPFDHHSIRNAVEPGNAQDPFGYFVIAAAGACELADRTQFNDVSPQVDAVLTGVRIQTNMPVSFQVLQNFPNPFNCATIIPFELGQSCSVFLDVFDIRGRKITSLGGKRYTPGSHSIPLDAGDLVSGTYFYRVRAGEHGIVKRMVLIK